MQFPNLCLGKNTINSLMRKYSDVNLRVERDNILEMMEGITTIDRK